MAEAFDPQRLGEAMQRIAHRRIAATADGGQSFLRLLQLAETQDSGQEQHTAHFIAATYNGEALAFDLFALRSVVDAIGDDLVLCIDALLWGQSDLHRLVPDGDRRRIWDGRAVIEQRGLTWPEAQ